MVITFLKGGTWTAEGKEEQKLAYVLMQSIFPVQSRIMYSF